MPKTSININEEDKQFALNKGVNVSDGIRYCINYVRNRDIFKQELKEILFSSPPHQIEKEIDNDIKTKLLKIMEDD